MKIGIIVHSQTGNTLSVGEKIREKLILSGHSVTLHRIQNLNGKDPAATAESIQLDSMPTIDGYDALIFGGWVQAFNLCPGVTKYLNQLENIEAKPVSCFVTHHFPFKWMGGTGSLSKMKKILESKGAKINASDVINWSSKKRESQIDEVVAVICATIR